VAITADTKQLLLESARKAAARAHCPISRFHVGAAVLSGGEIFVGCNIENASFGLTICAERVALFNAISRGKTEIEAIAVACPDADKKASDTSKMPCGACRQVMTEFGTPDLIVLVDGVGEFTREMLLPMPFEFRQPPKSNS
jgi:cytidine deaminase